MVFPISPLLPPVCEQSFDPSTRLVLFVQNALDLLLSLAADLSQVRPPIYRLPLAAKDQDLFESVFPQLLAAGETGDR